MKRAEGPDRPPATAWGTVIGNAPYITYEVRVAEAWSAKGYVIYCYKRSPE